MLPYLLDFFSRHTSCVVTTRVTRPHKNSLRFESEGGVLLISVHLVTLGEFGAERWWWPTFLPCYVWLLHCGTSLIKCFQPLCRAAGVVGKVKANIWLSNEPGRAKLGRDTGRLFLRAGNRKDGKVARSNINKEGRKDKEQKKTTITSERCALSQKNIHANMQVEVGEVIAGRWMQTLNYRGQQQIIRHQTRQWWWASREFKLKHSQVFCHSV